MDVKYAYANFVIIRRLVWHVAEDRTGQFVSLLCRTIKEIVEQARPAIATQKDVTNAYVSIADAVARRSLARLNDDFVVALLFPGSKNDDFRGPPVDGNDLRETLIKRTHAGAQRLVALAIRDGADWPELCSDPTWVPFLDQIGTDIRIEAASLLTVWQDVLDGADNPIDTLPVGATTMIPVATVLNTGVVLAQKVISSASGNKKSLSPEEDNNDRIAHRALLNVYVDRISREGPDAYRAVADAAGG